jgi:hypothetical protein
MTTCFVPDPEYDPESPPPPTPQNDLEYDPKSLPPPQYDLEYDLEYDPESPQCNDNMVYDPESPQYP